MLNETEIRCFLNLTETLSFTETARNLYMTQQAVSKHIARLEDDLGFQLFIRTHHYVALTRAGESFRDLFVDFSRRFGTVLEETRQYYNNMYNTLRIGFLEWLDITRPIGQAMRLLQNDRPELRLTVERHPQYELNQMFAQRKLDLIITYQEFAPKGTGLRHKKVLDTPLVLLVSDENPRATESATVEDFRTEPFIKAAASAETLSESKARAMRQCKELGFVPSEVIVAPNLESAYMATELGQGVLVSTLLSRMSLNSQLHCYPVGQTEELLCFWYEDEENPAVEVFARYLENSDNPKDGIAGK